MAMKKYLSTPKFLTVSISTAAFIVSSLPTASIAQFKPPFQVSVKFPPGANVGAPPRTTGTGARKAPCGFKDFTHQQTVENSQESEISLTALTPTNNVVTTLAPNPTVYIYIPKTINKTGEFRLIEVATEKIVYETNFPLVQNAGIMKVSMPKTVKVEANKKYQWQFMVICNPNDREGDEMIQGWIERTNLNPEQIAKIAEFKEESLEKARLYVEYGIWNESVNTLAQLRDQNPTAKTEWAELLNSVNLGNIAENNLFDCCSLASSPMTQP
ncbi:MAG: DUF928 domain-containing protein [Cuspidothrix sp.]